MSDAVAALRQWRIRFAVGGEVFTIPQHSAREWLLALLSGDVMDLLDLDDQVKVEDLFDDGQISTRDLYDAQFQAVTAASGRPWEQAFRLAQAMQDDASRGEVIMAIDLDRISIAAALDVIYALSVRYLDKDKRTKYDLELNAPAPVPGESPRTAAERARQQTRDALAQRQSSDEQSAG